jgi:hypothetical protein
MDSNARTRVSQVVLTAAATVLVFAILWLTVNVLYALV